MQSVNHLKVLLKIVKELNIPVTSNTIVEELIKHPDYPSLLAISDVLNGWKVPNAAYQLTFEELAIAEAPTPFIACLPMGEFMIVNEIDSLKVVISNERWNRRTMPSESFKQQYTGTILLLERSDASGEKDYAEKRRKEKTEKLRIPFVGSGIVTMIVGCLLLNPSYVEKFTWLTTFLTLFKTSGVAVSVLLLMQNINSSNPLIQRFCGSDSNKNCNAILSSKAAKVTDELSWSEVGFFYFAGTWLALLFQPANKNLIQTLALLNIVSLPYTFYSIYYQWKIAKQWCIFCLSAQILLWFEFFAFLPYIIHGISTPNLTGSYIVLISMVAPITLWAFVKPHLLGLSQIEPLKQQLYGFKYNAGLFNNILDKEVRYGLLSDDDSIIIGNPEATNIVTMVSNPFCPPCAKAHKILDDLVVDRTDIKLQLVFIPRIYTRVRDQQVAAHFMSLKSSINDSFQKEALNDWYGQQHKDFKKWQMSYPASRETESSVAMKKQREWCRMTEIKKTPTIFVNGRKLPSIYSPEDLKYVLV